MEKICKVFKCPVVLAVALNIIFFLVYLVCGSCRFASTDDFFMSSILSGAYGGEIDVHLYFVNAVYGCFLKPLYSFIPSVGWYYVFEVFEVFVSLFAIAYVLLLRLGMKYGGILAVLLLSCLSPIFYYEIEFTKNAAILTAAGMLLLSLGNAKLKRLLVFGSLLAVVGFVMRKDSFYLGMPILGLLLLFRWFYLKKFPLANVIAVLGCSLLIVGASCYDKSLYKDGEYKCYAAYQGPRAVFGDGRYYDYDAVVDEIEERDLHGVDFDLLTNWTFYDTETLAKDSLNKFLKIISQNRHDVVLSKMPLAVIRELSRSLHEINAWYWILLSIILVGLSKKSSRFVSWVSLCYIAAAYVYLLLLNRIVLRVEVPIWLYASILLIPFLRNADLNRFQLTENMKKIILVFAVLLYAIGFWNSPNEMKAMVFAEPQDERWNAFMQYEKNNADKLFFMDLTAYKRFCSRLGGSYKALEPGRLDHIIPLGYWNVHLPSIKKILHEQGIENPMRAITNSNVLVVNYDKASKYEEFLKLHYGYDVLSKNLLWSKVPGREFFSFDVTRFYIKEDKFEK